MANARGNHSLTYSSKDFCNSGDLLEVCRKHLGDCMVTHNGSVFSNKERVNLWLESAAKNSFFQNGQNSELDSEKAKNFLDWAHCHSQLKVVSAEIPEEILPTGFSGKLHDIKVFSKGPDDAVYDKDAGLRRKVARGNCILELRSPSHEVTHSCVVYALKKFTGGLGDDDDRDQGDNFTWKLYFTKEFSDAKSIVCTSKANGEAAHFSACVINDEVYLCAGSKNVHMMFRNRDDLFRYDLNNQRYKIALEVAHSVLDVIEDMKADVRLKLLLQFLCLARVTGVAEILHPDHPHIEDFSHLQKPVMKFIAWTSNDLHPESDEHCLTKMPPDVAIEIARSFDLDAIDYTVIKPDQLDERMLEIRQRHGVEGEVLVFLDEDQNSIGLLKKKSVWYIIVRAIREKAKAMASRYRKNPTSVELYAENKKVKKRLNEIQQWLDLEQHYVNAWMSLSEAFFKWIFERLNKSEISDEDMSFRFPIYWNKFLKESGCTDRISLSTC